MKTDECGFQIMEGCRTKQLDDNKIYKMCCQEGGAVNEI